MLNSSIDPPPSPEHHQAKEVRFSNGATNRLYPAQYGHFTAHIFICILCVCGIVMASTRFEWDQGKNRQNHLKHGVAFELAQLAFADPNRVIAEDLQHSGSEKRYYCFGKAGGGIMTVRFAYRDNVIRILGAGYWRRGKKVYERENKIHE